MKSFTLSQGRGGGGRNRRMGGLSQRKDASGFALQWNIGNTTREMANYLQVIYIIKDK